MRYIWLNVVKSTRLRNHSKALRQKIKSITRKSMNQPIQVQAGSGNVFADLELENSDELLVKAELARRISGIIAAKNMTQTEAAEMLGIDQPKVSALVNGKLSGFSTTRLFRFLNALGQDVEIVVKPKSFRQAETRVVAL
jgi:predicted XRE-type DNA-binding protein